MATARLSSIIIHHTHYLTTTARWSSSLLTRHSFHSLRTPILPPASPLPLAPFSTYNKKHSFSVSTTVASKKRITTKRIVTSAQEKEVSHEFSYFRVFKDGAVDLLHPPPKLYTPSDIKNVDISTDPCAPLEARIFLPNIPNPNNKLPVFLFFHGSGFCSSSAFTEEYTNYVAAIANEAKVLAVSVEYSKFPTCPPPACYEDAWKSLEWVESHAGGNGPEDWLNEHADLQRIFVAGNSAGGNLAHWVASLAGKSNLQAGASVEGAILVHPFFGGIGEDEQWLYMCKEKKGPEDSRLKPTAEDLKTLGCKRVLVFVAGKDRLLVAGRNYVTALKKSGWNGHVELVENRDMEHTDPIYKPYDDNSREIIGKMASFVNEKSCCC
ncbi:hypothetical protein PIB30_053919 [Stylosanthes scabra]|uniref:Alpha/beta hydrolase fold-3 domain-containing protein n=1 Tax=Stylosanthes scabra TaxID=79078 RepID=A0ABU6QIK2_9FABA|nr:hypothetical protein [Stylosanthes scabra]